MIIRPEELGDGGTVVVSGPRFRHIRDVLKKGAGDIVCAGLLNGPLGEGHIVAVERDALRLLFKAGEVPREQRVDLILAMPRPKVMKRLWSAVASLGVRSITIIGAAKVEACYFSSHALEEGIYLPRLIEGLEQARDTRLPVVRIFPESSAFMKSGLPDLCGEGLKLLAHPGASSTMRETLQANANSRIAVAIGPEGGWMEEEVRAFENYGFIPSSLGTRILRTDTAVIAALALATSP